MNRPRIVHVVDDDPAVRQSLSHLLSAVEYQVVLHDSPQSLLDADPLAEGCALIDIRMPRMNGLELQTRLTDIGSPLKIVVMSGHGDIKTAVHAIKAGAVDFLEKPFSDEGLLAAVERAMTHSPQTHQSAISIAAQDRIARLSPREYEVLIALSRGKIPKNIAYDVGLSVRTVEAHRSGMLRRLGVRTLAEAVRLLMLSGVDSSLTN